MTISLSRLWGVGQTSVEEKTAKRRTCISAGDSRKAPTANFDDGQVVTALFTVSHTRISVLRISGMHSPVRMLETVRRGRFSSDGTNEIHAV